MKNEVFRPLLYLQHCLFTGEIYTEEIISKLKDSFVKIILMKAAQLDSN